VKSFSNIGKDKDKKLNSPKEKGNPISCWIYVKDIYAKIFPLKYKFFVMEKFLESWFSLISTLEEVQKRLEVMGDINPRRSLEASRSNGFI
jgi:hypothetical protein